MRKRGFIYHKASIRKGAAKGGDRAAPRSAEELAIAREALKLPPVRDYVGELAALSLDRPAGDARLGGAD